MDLLVGDRSMFDALGNDDQLPLVEPEGSVAELHTEASLDDEGQLVLRLVVVPRERTRDPHDLHVLPIQLTDDLRTAVVGEERELFGEVHLVGHEEIMPERGPRSKRYQAARG